jgi:hypothetical protein
MPRKYTLQQVKDKLEEKDLSMVKKEYINSKTKFDIIDTEGYKYEISFNEYLQYNKQLDKFSKYNPHTIENIKLWLKLNGYKNKLLSTEYINSDKKLIFTCEDCGQSYEVSFKHFRNANQNKCKECAKKLATEKDRFSLEYIKEYFKSKELILINDNYIGVKQRLSAYTKEKYKIKISYNSLSICNGNFEIFSKSNPYTIYNIGKYIELNNLPCRLISKSYSASKDKLIFQCKCGDKFTTTLNSFLHQDKYRCDNCTKKQSKLSYLTENYLKENQFNYRYEYRIDECRNIKPLPFDFAIFDNENNLKLLIELDGIQHFEPTNFNGLDYVRALKNYEYTKNNDNIKNEYCKNNNIQLLRIPYWEFKKNNYLNELNNKLYTQI